MIDSAEKSSRNPAMRGFTFRRERSLSVVSAVEGMGMQDSHYPSSCQRPTSSVLTRWDRWLCRWLSGASLWAWIWR